MWGFSEVIYTKFRGDLYDGTSNNPMFGEPHDMTLNGTNTALKSTFKFNPGQIHSMIHAVGPDGSGGMAKDDFDKKMATVMQSIYAQVIDIIVKDEQKDLNVLIPLMSAGLFAPSYYKQNNAPNTAYFKLFMPYIKEMCNYIQNLTTKNHNVVLGLFDLSKDRTNNNRQVHDAFIAYLKTLEK